MAAAQDRLHCDGSRKKTKKKHYRHETAGASEGCHYALTDNRVLDDEKAEVISLPELVRRVH